MNSVNIIGRAVAQPTLRYVGQTNRPLAEFTLAYDDPYSKSAEGKPKAFFFLVVIWGNKAEVAHKWMVKGQRVGVTGSLGQESFTPAGSDKPVTKTRIICDSFDLMEKPQGYAKQETTQPQQSAPPESFVDEDDIPF